MNNLFKRIKYGIKHKCLKYALFKLEDVTQERPHEISPLLIKNIFKFIPREKWYDIIKPLIWDINPKGNGVYIVNDPIDPYPFIGNRYDILEFNLNDLLRKEFNIEPCHYYTHKKLGGIFIAESYIALDERNRNKYDNEDALATDRILYGSVVEGIGITNDGYSYGWEKGHIFLQAQDVYYTDFEPIDYKPKEGEFLYYIEKIYKKELTQIDDSTYYNSIWGATKDLIMLPGDTSHKEYFESFFNEYKK